MRHQYPICVWSFRCERISILYILNLFANRLVKNNLIHNLQSLGKHIDALYPLYGVLKHLGLFLDDGIDLRSLLWQIGFVKIRLLIHDFSYRPPQHPEHHGLGRGSLDVKSGRRRRLRGIWPAWLRLVRGRSARWLPFRRGFALVSIR